MKIINLLPPEEQKQVKYDIWTSQIVKFWMIVILSMLVFFVLILGFQVFLRQSLANTEDQILTQSEELKSADNKKLEEEVRTLNNEINRIKNLRAQHYEWSKVLTELANMLPADASLDLVSVDRSTGKVEISGTAGSRESVIAFWSNAKKSKLIKSINFPLSNLEKPRNSNFTYTIFVNEKELIPQ